MARQFVGEPFVAYGCITNNISAQSIYWQEKLRAGPFWGRASAMVCTWSCRSLAKTYALSDA